MPKKVQTEQRNSKPVTQDFLVEQLQSFEKRIDAKIEYSRKDAREQLESVAHGLRQKIDGVEQSLNQKIDGVEQKLSQRINNVEKRLSEEIHYTQLAVREVKGDTIRIEKKLDAVVEKVERHDEEIIFLKAAVAKS